MLSLSIVEYLVAQLHFVLVNGPHLEVMSIKTAILIMTIGDLNPGNVPAIQKVFQRM